jgi:hypothetical protein
MRVLKGGGHVQQQNVANTPWADATIGREPGKGVMRELEGRSVSGTFTAQGVANIYTHARSGRLRQLGVNTGPGMPQPSDGQTGRITCPGKSRNEEE